MINKKITKKKILYRSTHRGTKEMDYLLGNFVKSNINKLNDFELKELHKLVEMDDEFLKELFFNKNISDKKANFNKLNKILKKFKY